MEINDPSMDSNSPFFVTNGLLVRELVSGNMWIGYDRSEARSPANINVAGDGDDPHAPTYMSFRNVAKADPSMGKSALDKRGQAATATIDRHGVIGDDPSKKNVSGVVYAYYDSNIRQNIPEVFWQFLNQSGPVIENNQVVNGPISTPWYYDTGLPISDAYWSPVKIGGTQEDVLIQLFERRVLVYILDLKGTRGSVQMGDVGRHYYAWRYQGASCIP